MVYQLGGSVGIFVPFWNFAWPDQVFSSECNRSSLDLFRVSFQEASKMSIWHTKRGYIEFFKLDITWS